MAKRIKLARQYYHLRGRVNEFVEYKYGGIRGKSNEYLHKQIKTMKQYLRDYKKYGDLFQTHNFKLNYYRLLKEHGEETLANRIKAMPTSRFKDFYEWANGNFFDSEIFDFNDWYEDTGTLQKDEASSRLSFYLDLFYASN